jgi:diguanylate cyclase (GGDEF)-like protein
MAGVLLGQEPACRRGLLRWALNAQSYAVALALLFVGAQEGFAAKAQVQLLASYCALGLLAFYVTLRTGWSARLGDPMLTFPMALFSVSTIVLSYVLAELNRAAALQLLFLLVVFDMRHLSRRQIHVITFGATGMLLAALAFLATQATPGFDLRLEIVNIVMAGVMLPVLGMVASEMRRMRRKKTEQRKELEDALERLQELSMRDPLTGLFNRRHLLSLLDDEARRQARSHHAFCLAIVDLDQFKRINDDFGHRVGDAVLRNFARLATDALRAGDAIGRWGGEEFVLMLCDADTDAALLGLARLRQAVARHDWSTLAPGLQVSFSAGVCPHARGADLTRTLERADGALYAAKAAGRDCALAADAAP